MSLLLVVVGRGEVLHDEAGAALAEHCLPPLADDVISAAQLVLQEDPHALAHAVAVPLGHRATDDLVLLDGEAAHLEVRLLDGIPLVLAVVVAAVDHAGHGVPADAHLALHLAGVLLHQQAQQAHLQRRGMDCGRRSGFFGKGLLSHSEGLCMAISRNDDDECNVPRPRTRGPACAR